MSLKNDIKRKIATFLIFTSIGLSACSKNEENERQRAKREDLIALCTVDNVIELDALRTVYNTSFSSTEEIINILKTIEPSVLHIGEFYVSQYGGPIEVANYYGECIQEYDGGEIPYGSYLNEYGKLVKNCALIITYTENGLAYSLPEGYILKREIVTEESISYEEFLTYDLEEITITNPLNKDKKFMFTIN